MIHAYDQVYLDKARVVLGRMLDFAVYDLNYDITEFFNMFLNSGRQHDLRRAIMLSLWVCPAWSLPIRFWS